VNTSISSPPTTTETANLTTGDNLAAYSERIHQHGHQKKLQEIEFCPHFGFARCEVQVFCCGKERPEEAVEKQHLEGGDGGEPIIEQVLLKNFEGTKLLS